MRKKHENQLKKWLVAKLSPHMHIQSHEDKYSCGIPDLDGCHQSTAFWMELKIIDDWPANEGITLHSKLRHLTNEQCNWMKKRSNHGGRVYLLLKVIKTKEFILFRGQDARKIKELTVHTVKDLQLAHWQRHIPTDELLWELCRHRFIE